MLTDKQVQQFLGEYTEQGNDMEWCNVCSTPLTRGSKRPHHIGPSHERARIAAGLLSPTEIDVCHCLTCRLSFRLTQLDIHVTSASHKKNAVKGKLKFLTFENASHRD